MLTGGVSVTAGCGGQFGTAPADNETEAEPLPPAEGPFRVTERTIPERTVVGESIELRIVIENTGEEPYQYRNRLIAVPEGPRATEHAIDVTVPAGGTAEWTAGPVQFEHAGIIEYRLPDTAGFEPATLVVEPVSKAPRLQAVNLVSEWTAFGDTFENATEEATVGELIEIADRHRYWHDDGAYQLFRQVEITDEDDTRVAIEQRTEDRTTDARGFETWEGMVWFDTHGWTPGTYTATVELRNETTGERSDPATTTFELVA